MAILVAADFGQRAWQRWWPLLEAALPQERLVRDRNEAAAADIDIALVANPTPGALAGLPALRLIQSLWAGVERLLADPTVPPQVPIARMVDPAMNQAMSEAALWAVLGLQRGFFQCAAQQRAAQWKPPTFRRADDITVAVLGLGEMGRTTAERLAQHGHRVVGWSRTAASAPGVRTQAGPAALAGVLACGDIVVNLLPLTPDTRGLFDARTFARMRAGASLVNLARGGHVVEADLLAALASGHLQHAVLDVFAVEPLPSGHPFWQHPQITVLPHIAAPTDPRSAVAVAAANVRAWRAGQPLAGRVDRARGY